MAKISELQKLLDKNYETAQGNWNNQLTNLNFGTNFTMSDAKEFFEATTLKSTRNWAISQELSANHDSQKKIIDSM